MATDTSRSRSLKIQHLIIGNHSTIFISRDVCEPHQSVGSCIQNPIIGQGRRKTLSTCINLCDMISDYWTVTHIGSLVGLVSVEIS